VLRDVMPCSFVDMFSETLVLFTRFSMRFEVITVVNVKVIVFCDVIPCCLVDMSF
jgi:hypothetical protein